MSLRPDPDSASLCRVVETALREDLGSAGDITTDACIPEGTLAHGRLVARETLVLAGLPAAREVFRSLDPTLDFQESYRDGDRVASGETVARLEGHLRPMLRGERTALNLLMRMSGIASTTRRAVDEIAGTATALLDTRKTAPGLRQLDKYAVACGGGHNHRMGLYDAAMIKDTHLGWGLEIEEAVARLLAAGVASERITAEVRNIEELERAIVAGAGRVLLDNADPNDVRIAVARTRGRAVLEVSGGLRLGQLRPLAEAGVDFLSLGCLTHSAPAADLALEVGPPR